MIIGNIGTIFGSVVDASRLVTHRAGVPVYRYWTECGVPPVTVVRGRRADLPEHRPHIHEFPVLWYTPDTAVVSVVAPGRVVDPMRVDPDGSGVGVFFDPAALGGDGHSPWPVWQAHPLLFPFSHGRSGGLLQLAVPADRRSGWDDGIATIEAEIAMRRDGFRQAVLAHLTLLLIDLARLADDVVGDLRRSGEPLLADVFTVIDRRLAEPLSLRDVADEVGMTAGHLTTLVRRRTGRTVGDWITERRMSLARELLATTALPVAEVAQRVGMADPGYFSRRFRRVHGASPRDWRRTAGTGIGTESP